MSKNEVSELQVLQLRQTLLQNRIKEEEQVQKEFFTNFNHELRTPLNAILGFSSLLHAEATVPPDCKEDLAIIIDNAKYLLGLVEDILNVSVHDFDLLPLQVERFDFHKLMGRLLPMIKLSLNGGVHIETQLSADTQWVNADPKKLRQILLNLLSNAAKYTVQGHIVITSACHTSGELNIVIKDTGVGIDSADMKRLFTAYESSSGRRDSTGLGLLLVKKLVDVQQGSIAIKSTLNQGTAVTLCFPAVLK